MERRVAMKRLLKQTVLILGACTVLCFLRVPHVSAWSFSVAQQNPAPVEFVMGTAVPVTYRVYNNSSGNGNQTLRNVRFYLANNTYTILPNPETFVAPNWTCSRNSNLRIYCNANNAAAYIPAGTNCSQYKDFTFYINSAALTQDRTDQLSSVTARFSGSNTYRNPTSLAPNSWTWKSFLMTLVPSASSIGRNCPFNLTMTVTNRTTSNITNPNYVTSQPNPPQMNSLSGGATAVAPAPPPPANIVPLNAGATNSMVWTYTAGANQGTLNFSAYARDSTSIRTSSIVTVNPAITITNAICASGNFTITQFANAPACLLSGDIATFTMTVQNTTGIPLLNVTPTALVRNGTATIGAFAGPVPASVPTLNNNSNAIFVWQAPVTANPADAIGQDYSVTGSATSATAGYPATNNVVTSSPTYTIHGYTITMPNTNTNADSTNAELAWSVTNSGCRNLNRVSIAIPAGWPAPIDAYSVVDNGAAQVETWTYAGGVFSTPLYPNPDPDEMPVGSKGTFYLFFPTTPAIAQPYVFNTTITDNTGAARMYNFVNETVTVDPYGTGTLNSTPTNVWQEDVR
jgi:hypothetical protein